MTITHSECTMVFTLQHCLSSDAFPAVPSYMNTLALSPRRQLTTSDFRGTLLTDSKTKQVKLNCRNWESGVVIPIPVTIKVQRLLNSGQKLHDLSLQEVFGDIIPVPILEPAETYHDGRRPWFFNGWFWTSHDPWLDVDWTIAEAFLLRGIVRCSPTMTLFGAQRSWPNPNCIHFVAWTEIPEWLPQSNNTPHDVACTRWFERTRPWSFIRRSLPA